jgi:hypothetical protein
MGSGNLILITGIHLQKKTIENVKKTIPTHLICYETNQPTTIEETLVLNGVVYDDIKLELVDHIAQKSRF